MSGTMQRHVKGGLVVMMNSGGLISSRDPRITLMYSRREGTLTVLGKEPAPFTEDRYVTLSEYILEQSNTKDAEELWDMLIVNQSRPKKFDGNDVRMWGIGTRVPRTPSPRSRGSSASPEPEAAHEEQAADGEPEAEAAEQPPSSGSCTQLPPLPFPAEDTNAEREELRQVNLAMAQSLELEEPSDAEFERQMDRAMELSTADAQRKVDIEKAMIAKFGAPGPIDIDDDETQQEPQDPSFLTPPEDSQAVVNDSPMALPVVSLGNQSPQQGNAQDPESGSQVPESQYYQYRSDAASSSSHRVTEPGPTEPGPALKRTKTLG